MKRPPRLRAVAVATALTASAALGAVALPGEAEAASAAYNTGYSLGHEAYEYGLPLLDTQRVYDTETSVNVADTSGDGPVNQFNSVPQLTIPSPSLQTVVAPNSDTLYSIAWLDLTQQPQVIHVPAIAGRFYVLAMYTPWTENFYNITSLAGSDAFGAYGVTSGGDYAVVPPGFTGTLPPGVHRIDSPYTRVWIIGRTLIRGAADTAAVNAIQQQYTVTPLSDYGQPYTPPAPANPVTTLTFATVPGTQPGEDPLDFYVALDRELTQFAPMPADASLLTKLRTIDVGAGLDPATDPKLSPDMLHGMRDAVTNGPKNLATELKKTYLTNSLHHNGYMVAATGTYGTNYQFRAIVDVVGLGAPRTNIAVYPFAQTDLGVVTLSGKNSYVLHIPAGKMPPVQAFWSLTMYDANGFFVPNTLGRYLLNDRSDLHRNPDGSIDIYVQQAAPTNATQLQNWLPAPAGNFRLMWRLYGPGSALPGILSGAGWKPPVIQTCVAGVGVPGLTGCAR